MKYSFYLMAFLFLIFASLIFSDFALSDTFAPGAYIIDMGQSTQTIANGLKPYGLIFDLVINQQVPVYWAIDPAKAKDGVDFIADGKPYSGGSLVTITIPDLEVTKVVDNVNPNEGDIINYTVTVTNNGPDTATNIEITDQIPVELSYVSDTPSQGNYNIGTGIWTVGSLVNGAGATLIIRATFDVVGNPRVINTASVTAVDQGDPDATNNTDTADINPIADISITKSDSPDPISVDGTLTYTLIVTNSGPSDASNLQVTDTLSVGVTFLSAVGSGWVCSESLGVVTCTLSSLKNGDSSIITITVTTPSSAGIITTTATVSASETDPNTSNNTVAENTTVLPPTDLSVTKTSSPNPVVVLKNSNTDLIYTIIVRNNGPADAVNVVAIDTLPPENLGADNGDPADNVTLSYVSSTASQGSCSYSGGTVTCDLGKVSKDGGVATVTIEVTTTVVGTITNTASVSSNRVDDNPSNNIAVQSTQVVEADGNPLPDGTIVTFTTTRGTFPNGKQEIKVPTKDGVAITHLTAEIVSNTPVETFAKAAAGTPEVGIVEDRVKIIFAPGAIAGIVVSKVKEMPIAGAEVTVIDKSGSVIGTDITDVGGNYQVFIPKTGDYTVTVKAKDDLNREVSFTEEVNVSAVFGAVFEPNNVIGGVVSDGETKDVLKGVTLNLRDDLGNPVHDDNGNPNERKKPAFQSQALLSRIYILADSAINSPIAGTLPVNTTCSINTKQMITNTLAPPK